MVRLNDILANTRDDVDLLKMFRETSVVLKDNELKLIQTKNWLKNPLVSLFLVNFDFL